MFLVLVIIALDVQKQREICTICLLILFFIILCLKFISGSNGFCEESQRTLLDFLSYWSEPCSDRLKIWTKIF